MPASSYGEKELIIEQDSNESYGRVVSATTTPRQRYNEILGYEMLPWISSNR